MQNIAMENNLAETAFVLKDEDKKMFIRWFTPTTEVDLCGHATLAAAHVLFVHENIGTNYLEFNSKKGILSVEYAGDLLTLDFPKDKIYQIEFSHELDCFNFKPKEVWRGTGEFVLIFENEEQVRNAICDLEKTKKLDLAGFIITAESNLKDIDFVSRCFFPKIGINEDPVTGSAHTLLVPYWEKILDKKEFTAIQLSKRGGKLYCQSFDSRVKISGKAVTYLIGDIFGS